MPPVRLFATAINFLQRFARNAPCLNATGALLPCLAPDHSGLEADVLRFDDPLQAARRCSTFPTDE